MIKALLKRFVPKPKPKVHEILGKDFEGKIIEDKDGNRYKIRYADWSGFSATCLDKENNPIMVTKVRNYTKESYTIEQSRMIGYYLKGYKLVE